MVYHSSKTVFSQKNMTKIKDLPALFVQAEKMGLSDELLQFLFTPGELEDLQKRLVFTAALLHQQGTQREIAKKYQISIAKITRGVNALKLHSPGFHAFLKRHLQLGE